MNLADHFEPMKPPQDGLKRVTATARRRAVARRLTTGGLALLVPVAIVSFGAFGAWSFDQGAVVQSDLKASGDMTSDNGNVPSITPNADGLPGANVAIATFDALAYFALIASLLAVLILAISVVQARVSDTPTLRQPIWARVAIGIVWVLPFGFLVIQGFLTSL